ncbi:MAG: hypothetical protein ACHQQQ_11070 [Bacteroidota bacterium]
MIIAVISQSGIVLGADTRCMVGSSQKYVGYHDHARKIAISPENSDAKMACAFSCTSWYGHSESPISIPFFNRKRGLLAIHTDIEYRFKLTNEECPCLGSSITSICAKYFDDMPNISFGDLGSEIKTKNRGFYSSPQIRDENIDINNYFPDTQNAISFVKDRILEASKVNRCIGPEADIVIVNQSRIEWVQGKERIIYPIKKKELLSKFKKREIEIVPLVDEYSLLKELEDNY